MRRGSQPAADSALAHRPTLPLIRMSRSTLGGDICHCIRAGLETHKALEVVEEGAVWQIKVAVNSRRWLAREIRLIQLILLHRRYG